MNEYQDQEAWYRLAVESDNPDGVNIVGDYGSPEEAEFVYRRAYGGSGLRYTITRMTGLPS